ncbi:SLC45A1_2_4 [Mytilus edulis]|uniref:SLC45A1_2_4 n=1 Tax=Mytilus edulis TaxID=6550 RepID=A0A8S3VMH6_MYTED|nr:SLC45A1_2_4 [Mytilus edulis]
MSIGLLTSSIQTLKRLRENADIYIQTVGEGIESFTKFGEDSSWIHKRKSRMQLLRLSAVVCGIELCYAAETAFVSPILLKLGVPASLMTLIWCASPFLGFFLVPLFGSLSDRCRFQFGRRRPFILILSVGIIFGLLLVPNGEYFGLKLGDKGTASIKDFLLTNCTLLNNTLMLNSSKECEEAFDFQNINNNKTFSYGGANKSEHTSGFFHFIKIPENHVYGIVLTIIGVALLDFCCDAAQSPCRSYLLDVCVPEDHSAGLTSFTIMAGFGGSVGYIMGGINWNGSGKLDGLEAHVRIVFAVVLIFFVLCVALTITSFKEVPLSDKKVTVEKLQKKRKRKGKSRYQKFTNDSSDDDSEDEAKGKTFDYKPTYGSFPKENGRFAKQNGNHLPYDKSDPVNKSELQGLPRILENDEEIEKGQVLEAEFDRIDEEMRRQSIFISTEVSLKTYLLSIVRMPKSLLILCLTNLFSWMSLVCYSLFFTDFVGQAVYGGDPKAPVGSREHQLYDEGVRVGSFGMSLYSLACGIYSIFIEKLVEMFKAKKVYIVGQLVYTFGMILMACSRHHIAVIVLSPTAGIMYATLFTMPYLILANYHTKTQFNESTVKDKEGQTTIQVRGLGTDVAVVSSMVFLAQFILSTFLGSIIDLVDSTVTVVVAAAILSFLGAISATQVVYLDL